MTSDSRLPAVAIIGGGFTGAAVAYHLHRLRAGSKTRIVVFEPRSAVGAGLAYDTDEPAHRINVPASRMSLVPDDGEHFQRWLAGNGLPSDDAEAATDDGHVFPRRGLFGRYVHDQLRPLLRDGDVEHRLTRVISVMRSEGKWQVHSEDGQGLPADILVVATSHPPPKAPSGFDRVLTGHPRYVADPTVPQALESIRPDHRVLVVGTGLTSADAIATLDLQGHRGEIVAISRRGLRSRGHNLDAQDPFGDFLDPPVTSARSLLRRVRQAVADAQNAGVTWHAVFDQLRSQGGTIWRSLPIGERRRLVKYLRPYWDVHRFRIAPQVEAALERHLAAGSLSVHAASVLCVERRGDDILVRLRRRHSGRSEEQCFDAVVITTGPGHGSILYSQPYMADLAAGGFLQADGVGLGLDVTEKSLAVGRDGVPVPGLYVAGPLARGTFGELMGLPQVTEHAVAVAGQICEQLERGMPEELLADTVSLPRRYGM
ncbi:MAG: FAD/NAD(P)-binding domain-containing protein [Shinella sp.]|nr:FAD/NAD(P)-binding domain-containing protein [Shinella sp.]